MSFISDFFGVGGTGSSLLSSAGTIGIGIVQNEGAKIQSDYALQLKSLLNDASLSQDQFKLASTKLEQERQSALAKAQDQKRNDQLIAVAIVGGLVVVTLLMMKVIKKRANSSVQSSKKPKK